MIFEFVSVSERLILRDISEDGSSAAASNPRLQYYGNKRSDTCCAHPSASYHARIFFRFLSTPESPPVFPPVSGRMDRLARHTSSTPRLDDDAAHVPPRRFRWPPVPLCIIFHGGKRARGGRRQEKRGKKRGKGEEEGKNGQKIDASCPLAA